MQEIKKIGVCLKCGNEASKDALFCMRCGTRLVSESSEAGNWFCTKCGTPIDE